MCVGSRLIFGVMRVINFAQGDFMMLGMYAAYLFRSGLVAAVRLSSAVHAGSLVTDPAGPVLFVVGYLSMAFWSSHVSQARGSRRLEGEGHYAQLILTLGIALIVQNAALIAFGSEPSRSARRYLRAAWDRSRSARSLASSSTRPGGIAALISDRPSLR